MLLSVKSNQKTLHRQISYQFQGKRKIPFVATDHGCSSRVLERRGQRRKARLEQQTATADSPPGLLGQTSNGPWLAGGSEPGGVVSGAPVIPRMNRDWYWRTIGWVSRV